MNWPTVWKYSQRFLIQQKFIIQSCETSALRFYQKKTNKEMEFIMHKKTILEFWRKINYSKRIFYFVLAESSKLLV